MNVFYIVAEYIIKERESRLAISSMFTKNGAGKGSFKVRLSNPCGHVVVSSVARFIFSCKCLFF